MLTEWMKSESPSKQLSGQLQTEERREADPGKIESQQ
jgi:hypothetical protein